MQPLNVQVTKYNEYYAAKIIQHGIRARHAPDKMFASTSHGSFEDHDFWVELSRINLTNKDKLELFDKLSAKYWLGVVDKIEAGRTLRGST